MPKHLGNLTVTAENALSFPAVTEFYGHLTLQAGVRLIVPSLVSIRGWLTLFEGSELVVGNLGRIEGWLMMRNQSKLDAPNLTAVTEVVVRYASEMGTGKLTSVGSLQVLRGAHLTMAVTDVKRGVSLASDSWLTANHLEKVGGSITLR